MCFFYDRHSTHAHLCIPHPHDSLSEYVAVKLLGDSQKRTSKIRKYLNTIISKKYLKMEVEGSSTVHRA